MVTITSTRPGENTETLIDNIATTEDAETILDRMSGDYWGLPGFTAKRETGKLIISAKPIGEPTTLLRTLEITAA